ncbi:hypothetical protein [Chitinophaga tropicalis]|uniref:Uncharacterized protein n=1 Tax=Chitinophaga tropicalis TaxID=2683588 RepID=A0A7K1U3R3_9BACT|nr:hypothetical protein [Chitinophaga tropicalis]MVT09002.1 hypothetical protein [Chitinophaga tropicalis]
MILSLADWEFIVNASYGVSQQNNRPNPDLYLVRIPGNQENIYVEGVSHYRPYDQQSIYNAGTTPRGQYRMRRRDIEALSIWARETLRGATLGRVMPEREGRDYLDVQVDNYGTLFNFHIYLAD